MRTQYHFQKNSAYDKEPPNIDTPMFLGVVDIDGTIYDGEIFRTVTEWGKEELILCLKNENTDAPF